MIDFQDVQFLIAGWNNQGAPLGDAPVPLGAGGEAGTLPLPGAVHVDDEAPAALDESAPALPAGGHGYVFAGASAEPAGGAEALLQSAWTPPAVTSFGTGATAPAEATADAAGPDAERALVDPLAGPALDVL
jgi:hypothetical protein